MPLEWGSPIESQGTLVWGVNSQINNLYLYKILNIPHIIIYTYNYIYICVSARARSLSICMTCRQYIYLLLRGPVAVHSDVTSQDFIPNWVLVPFQCNTAVFIKYHLQQQCPISLQLDKNRLQGEHKNPSLGLSSDEYRISLLISSRDTVILNKGQTFY